MLDDSIVGKLHGWRILAWHDGASMNGLALTEDKRMLLAGGLLSGEPLKGTGVWSRLVLDHQDELTVGLGWQIDSQLRSNVLDLVTDSPLQGHLTVVGLNGDRLDVDVRHIQQLKLCKSEKPYCAIHQTTHDFFDKLCNDQKFDGGASSQNAFPKVNAPVQVDVADFHQIRLGVRRWIGTETHDCFVRLIASN